MVDLKGKTALVTGATGGMGKEIAYALSKLGMNVCVNYSSEKKEREAGEIVRGIEKCGTKALAVCADVSNSQEVGAMFKEAHARLGSIFVLVNNAGIYAAKPGTPLHEVPEEEWDRVMNVNLKGVYLCAREAARQMIANKGGRIINISSVVGLRGSRAGAHYAASKAGVIGLTYALADELGQYGILANSVAPGPVKTKLLDKLNKTDFERMRRETPIGRIATEKEIADAVCFFAQTDIVNGQVMVVDGGRVKH
ncbi:hypothetical protein AUJ17_00430 [Candidatus Micrarchaeota archaeon CG1_02_47_40]|nr:MAG: hypothetical protein AUJ17_00430 [Candidatus Micrarchaeota archaeon CG1_02_47_40]